jgi:hypothetical protein
VESLENAQWLLGRLSGSFVFKSSEPIVTMHDSPECTFRVPHSSQTSGTRFERLLAAIPEVHLVLVLEGTAIHV